MGDFSLSESPGPAYHGETNSASPIPIEISPAQPQKTRNRSARRRLSRDRSVSPHPTLNGKLSPNQLSVGRYGRRTPSAGSRKSSANSSRRGSKSTASKNSLNLEPHEGPSMDELYNRIDKDREYDNESECSIPLPESLYDEVDALSDAFTNSSIRGYTKPPAAPKTAWGQFQEHIKGISSDAMHFQMKPTSSKGSGTFREVLTELQSEIPSRPRRSKNNISKKHMNLSATSVKQNNVVDDDIKDTSSKADSTELVANHDISVSVTTALPPGSLRNWKKVKHDLSDQHLDKVNEEKGSWDLVSRTAVQLTDQERARQQLYDRYLRHPTPWYEGLTLYNKYKHLLDDKKKLSRRPVSSPPMKRPGRRPGKGPTSINNNRSVSAMSEGGKTV